MQNINVYAAIAGWKEDKAGLVPIHISIDIDGKRAAFPAIKKRVSATDWDSNARRVKPSHLNAAQYNALISNQIGQYQGALTKMQLNGVTITKDAVKKYLNGTDSGRDFYAFCREQIALINYAKSTRKNYSGEITKMQKKFAPTLTFEQIDYAWLQLWEQYMRGDLNNTGNTVWKSLKFLNTMLNLAIKTGGIIDKNPFKKYSRGKFKQGIPVYLEWKEVQLFHKTIKDEHFPDTVRLCGYYFLLSCYSGLRFGDSIGFNYATQVTEGENGKRLILYTQKTGEIVSVAFNKYIAEIVDYLKDKSISIDTQTYNEYIKRIADAGKIGKEISSHTARHSFGMRCAELGMSIDDAQKLLGHGQRKSTAIYFRIKDQRLDDAMAKW